MKRFFQKPLFWLFGVTIISAGSGLAMLNLTNPTNVAETSADHQETTLRTRRYKLDGDLKQMRRRIEAIIPTVSTAIWGGKWQLAASAQHNDSTENKETVRVMVPVVFFTDDLQIVLTKDVDAVIVNVRSASRVGKSDFGENRRHILQMLKKLDEQFGF